MFTSSLSKLINRVWCLQGKPRPKVSWLKEGKAIDPAHVSIRNTECDSIIFIRKAERSHSGKYEMTVQVENHKDTAIIDIQIVGKWLDHTLSELYTPSFAATLSLNFQYCLCQLLKGS